MLAQLRLQYPDSCLITELLMIKHGKYVVKAEVRMAGLTIATSMGAADTIELAEDRARERVFAVVGLGVNPVFSPPVPSPSVMAIPSPIAAPVLPEIAPPEPEKPQLKTPEPTGSNYASPQGEAPKVVTESYGSAKVKTPEIQETEAQKAEFQGLKTHITQIQEPEMAKVEEPKPEVSKSELSKPELSKPELSKLEVVKAEPAEKPISASQSYTEAPILTIAPEISSPEKPEKSEKVVPLHVVTNGSTPQADPDHSVATLELPEETTPAKPEKVKATPETMPDIKDVMAKTEIEIRRLGWTTQQGRNFLLQRYGKRARTLLSDEELFDFLEYLESQS